MSNLFTDGPVGAEERRAMRLEQKGRYHLSCQWCGKGELVDGVKLSWCSRCNLTSYCSAACQKAHWSIHKQNCDIRISNAVSLEERVLADPLDVRCQAEAHDFVKEIMRDVYCALRSAYRLTTPSPIYKDYIVQFKFHYDPAPVELRRRYTLIGGGIKTIESFQIGEDLNDAPKADKKNWLQLCSQEHLRNRPGQKNLTQYNCCLSVIFYMAPAPRINRGAPESWVTVHQPLMMDLPEPGLPRSERDPDWYESFKADLAGPGPGDIRMHIRRTFKRAELNSKKPKRVYGPKDPRRFMAGGGLPEFMGEFAEMYSDDVDKIIREDHPDLAAGTDAASTSTDGAPIPPPAKKKKNKKKKKKAAAVGGEPAAGEVAGDGEESAGDDEDVAELERRVRETLGTR